MSGLYYLVCILCLFFKLKTAYEMRISYWSSDVCSSDLLEAARAAGFEIGAQREPEGLGLHVVVLRAPRGMDTATALARLRALDPQGSYDFNHLYFGSAAAAERTANTPARAATPAPLRIGLIDSGVAGSHPALRATELHAWGCDGKSEEHTSELQSLMRISYAVFCLKKNT